MTTTDSMGDFESGGAPCAGSNSLPCDGSQVSGKNASPDNTHSNTYSRHEDALEEVPLKLNLDRATPPRNVYLLVPLFFLLHRHQRQNSGSSWSIPVRRSDISSIRSKQMSANACCPHVQEKHHDEFISPSQSSITSPLLQAHLYPGAPYLFDLTCHL
jgi:hypothetical protein